MANSAARDWQKEAKWRRWLRAHAESGLTVRAWCRRHAQRESAFYWWRTQVARRDAEYLPGHNSSYKRAVLVEYGDDLVRLMEAETILMWDLRAKGQRLLLDPTARTAHMNFGLWSSRVRVMFLNGRAFAHTRSAA